MIQNFTKKQRGFTLVELLVVIAIIGLLSTIVIVSFGTVRNQAKDSAIKANLDQMRLAAEMTYANNGNYVGANTRTDWNAALASVNTACGCSGVGIVNGTGTAWCVSANTVVDSANWWCLDSAGNIGNAKKCNAATWRCE